MCLFNIQTRYWKSYIVTSKIMREQRHNAAALAIF